MVRRKNNVRIFSENISYILGCVRKKKFPLNIIIFFEAIISATMPFLLLFLSREVINSLNQNQRTKNVIITVLEYLVAYLICYSLRQFLGWQRSLMCMKLYDSFCTELARKASRMALLDMEDEINLNLYHKAEKSIWYATIGLCAAIDSFVSSSIQLIGYIYLFAYMNGWLVMVFLCMILIHLVTEKKCKTKIYENTADCTTYERKIKYLTKTMIGAKEGIDIRLFSAENRILGELKNNQDKYHEKYTDNTVIKTNQTIVDLVLAFVLRLVVYCYFVWQFIANKISVGDFAVVILATETLYNLLLNIPGVVIAVWDYGMYVQDYREYMNRPMKKAEIQNTKIVVGTRPILCLEHVFFKYPNAAQDALIDISLTISYGEKVMIVGDNGSGKSTFIKMLLGLYTPDKGNVMVNSTNIQKYDYDEYVQLFSVVFQDYRIFEFSIADNVYLDLVKNAEKEQKFWSSLKKSGLYDRVNNLQQREETSVFRNFDENGVLLSGGEQQKLAVARALFHDRDIFIFDEPAASMDPKSEQNFYKEVESYTQGKTVIYISHRMSRCVPFDRIIVFEGGRIVADGRHEDLLRTSCVYQKMWEAQAKYYL